MAEHTWLSKSDMKKVSPAYEKDWESPIPTQQVSNGEYMPLPQTDMQKKVERLIHEKADVLGKKLGMNRRDFLKTSSGMAAAFMAMNEVFGNIFKVDAAEAADPAAADARLAALKGQFIFDDQTHHVSDNYGWEGLLFLQDWARGNNPEKKPLNRALLGKKSTLDEYKFEQYLKDIFLDSETAVWLLSGFTSDTPENEPLSNSQITDTRNFVNKLAGKRRMYAHGLFLPPKQGNLDDMRAAAEVLKIDSWKAYTVGDPLGPSRYPWRMDDEKVAYPCWELADKTGIRNVCIHKGLIPADYKSFKNWKFATVDDLGKCAKDWPQLNFIIYHAAMRPGFDYGELSSGFEKTGEIPWIDDMAQIRDKYGVDNVYAEIGSTFGTTAILYPRLAAAILGKLVKGCGYDHVCWGTDSVWYGSPQWQIEAFRRIEIPDDVQKKLALSPLGAGDGKIKSTILGYNSARLYGMSLTADGKPTEDFANDGLAKIKDAYLKAGPDRDNMYYGWIRKERDTVA